MSIKEIELAMYEFVQGHNFSEPQKKAVIDFVFAQLEKFGASQAQQTTEPELSEPFGYLSVHKVEGPFKYQFNKERAAVYPDNAISIDAVFTATQMHDHFAAGVRAGMAQSQWQPIDSAPKDEIVMVAVEFDCAGDWRIKVGYEDSENGCWKVWGASWTPTHWMPLPTPPKEQQ